MSLDQLNVVAGVLLMVLAVVFLVPMAVNWAIRRRNARRYAEREAINLAWGIIANVDGGNWTRQSKEWQRAAMKWRDEVLP